MLIALPVTFLIWQNEKSSADMDQQLRFEYRAEEAHSLIMKQLTVYQQSLIGIQSFFRASSFVSQEEFADYVEVLLHPSKHLGLQQVGFAKYVDLSRPETHEAIRGLANALPLNASSAQPIYAPILYALPVPLTPSIKYTDAFGHADTKRAMYQALDANAVVISSKTMVDAQGNTQQGFVMQLPIYTNNGDLSTLSLKRANVDGWVFINMLGPPFFKEALHPMDETYIRFTLFDHPHTQTARTLYRSAVAVTNKPSRFTKTMSINHMGHDWVLLAESLPKFEANVDYRRANEIGLLGFFTSLALAGILYLLIARLRALDAMQKVNSKLQHSEQRWQFALEGAGDGVWDWDITTNKVLYSKRWKEMLGFSEDELDDKLSVWRSRIHPEDAAAVLETLAETLWGNNSMYSDEYRMQCKDGSWKWILDRGMVVSRDARGAPLRMVGTHADISNIKESEEAIWQHANFDLLTGLPNRRNFYGRLDQEIKKAKRSGSKVALIFLDLDKFKEVNDTQGHDQGDFLLKLTANRLTECMRGTDAVARLGGDEFVLIIGEIQHPDLSGVEAIAQKVLETLSEPYYLNSEVAYISASLGIVIYPDDALTIEDLMKSVDQAMYASKQKGGRCFTYFTPHMQHEAQHRMQLSNDLRVALSRGELFVEYQPIVHLKTGAISKAEALLRWRHPVRGLVSPAEFIPIAEDTRLIQEIGAWVFQQAIAQAQTWRQRIDAKFQIAVNKSPVQFASEDPQAVDWIDTLRSTSSGDLIVVEITERLLLDASGKVKERLKLYQEAGIQVALDDFGTGYSSLSYLKKFDIDYLKIDKSFVANIAEGTSDLALCEAIIVMAHRLGMQVVAEGIETELQRSLLMQAGCDFGQGFLFAKSMSSHDFEQYLAKNLTA